MEKKKRDRLDIYADILTIAEGGSKKTPIVYGANLNFGKTEKFLEGLEGKKLVESKKQSPRRWFVTERGQKFLRHYRKIREILPRGGSK